MSNCTACKTSLNIFLRKKCQGCSQPYCTRCLTTIPANPQDTLSIPNNQATNILPIAVLTALRARRVCIKCAMLMTGDYTRDDLSTRYTSRELRAFLVSQQMPVDGCREKRDLVDLAMLLSRGGSAGRGRGSMEDEEHMLHIAQLKEKMSELKNSDAPASGQNSQSLPNEFQPAQDQAQLAQNSEVPQPPRPPRHTPSNSSFHAAVQMTSGFTVTEQNSMGENPMRFSATVSGEARPGDTVHVTLSASSLNSSASVESAGLSASVGNSTGSEEPAMGFSPADCSQLRPGATTADVPSTSSPNSTPVHRRITLSEINDAAMIETLTIRQLKELLVNNFVDYKGCCERSELIDRVRLLWLDHSRNTEFAASVTAAGTDTAKPSGADAGAAAAGVPAAEAFETTICKICMDAVIDCILLECGHMVTCTGCGKKLAECPICRRYVTRVVHVFRA